MLKNKAVQLGIAVVYIVFFIWMWINSKQPTLRDVPLLFAAGLVVSLLCVITIGNRKANTVLMIMNFVLLLTNIVMYFAAYRLISGALKN